MLGTEVLMARALKYVVDDNNLTIDSWHGDVMIQSFDVEDADVDWNS